MNNLWKRDLIFYISEMLLKSNVGDLPEPYCSSNKQAINWGEIYKEWGDTVKYFDNLEQIWGHG